MSNHGLLQLDLFLPKPQAFVSAQILELTDAVALAPRGTVLVRVKTHEAKYGGPIVQNVARLNSQRELREHERIEKKVRPKPTSAERCTIKVPPPKAKGAGLCE